VCRPVELTDGKGGGMGLGRSQIMRRRESLANYKSFNTICSVSRKDLDYWFNVLDEMLSVMQPWIRDIEKMPSHAQYSI
jgi:hypothetical protein